jgi:hypothetical protein
MSDTVTADVTAHTVQKLEPAPPVPHETFTDTFA